MMPNTRVRPHQNTELSVDHRSQESDISGWSIEKCHSLFRPDQWGQGYFQIQPNGNLAVLPSGPDGKAIDLYEIIEGLSERGLQTPVLLRFSDILKHRLTILRDAFQSAIDENEFQGGYLAAYPIKVNQQHQIVEEDANYGHTMGFGLEVGSKPELLAVLAMTAESPGQIIICNGFKDEAYIEAVTLSYKLGRQIYPVVESLRELRLIIATSEKHGVRPKIGVRVKLASSGSGRWGTSVGLKSKFGLTTTELLQAVGMLRRHDMLDCLDLLHCHSGSQHQDIATIKQTLTELTHVYVQLKQLGARLSYLDIGGGLGVDYQGSVSDRASSMNYNIQEYASDVVYRIASVCKTAGISEPTIITECGRAMVAYSSVLVFNILGSTGPSDLVDPDIQTTGITDSSPQPLQDLKASLDSMREPEPRLIEIYHDATKAREESLSLFSLGYLSLEQRAESERLFWTVCAQIQQQLRSSNEIPEPLAGIDDLMSETYFANFSLFQSLPDTWAIDQLFPMMPIHRLDEEPRLRAVISDITCDSDGKIDQFISEHGAAERALPVHDLIHDSPYYIGVFLVGAYQETLGDLHNLFGDPHAVHIQLDGDDWSIEEVVRGDTISEVLRYVQYEPEKLARSLERECERAVRRKDLSVLESRILTQFYTAGLSGYTYLDPDQTVS